MVPEFLSLRSAIEADCDMLWHWRNDETTREWSFNSGLIPFAVHKKWLSAKLNNPLTKILIVLNNSKGEIGQIRFDTTSDNEAEVNISIIASERNKGYGTSALKLACQYALRELNIKRIVAHIKADNQASLKIFTKGAFVNTGKKNKVVEMIYEFS